MTIHIDNILENQLTLLSSQIGQSPDDVVREALLSYFDEIEDALKAREVQKRDERLWTQEEVERDLGFRD